MERCTPTKSVPYFMRCVQPSRLQKTSPGSTAFRLNLTADSICSLICDYYHPHDVGVRLFVCLSVCPEHNSKTRMIPKCSNLVPWDILEVVWVCSSNTVRILVQSVYIFIVTNIYRHRYSSRNDKSEEINLQSKNKENGGLLLLKLETGNWRW